MEDDLKEFMEEEKKRMPIPLDSLLQKEFSEPKWIIDNLIPHGGVNLISADPGSGKTWLALVIALSVAQGIPLFEQINTSQTGVLLIEEEMGERRLKERMVALSTKPESYTPIHFLSRTGFRLVEARVYDMVQFCKSNSVGLVILDSFVRLHNAKEENSATEMAKVFNQIAKFTTNDITVIITHHHRKQAAGSNYSMQSPRGSSDITAAVDSHLLIKMKDDILTISNPKARHSENADDLKIQMKNEGDLINFQLLGQVERVTKEERMKKLILEGLKNCSYPPSKNALLLALTKEHRDVPRNLYLQSLDELIKAGGIIATAGQKNTILLSLNPAV